MKLDVVFVDRHTNPDRVTETERALSHIDSTQGTAVLVAYEVIIEHVKFSCFSGMLWPFTFVNMTG